MVAGDHGGTSMTATQEQVLNLLPFLRTVAEELNTMILRTRKLLITAEYFSTATSRMVQETAQRVEQ